MIQSGISYTSSQPKVGYKLSSFKRHLELTFFLVLIKLMSFLFTFQMLKENSKPRAKMDVINAKNSFIIIMFKERIGRKISLKSYLTQFIEPV